MWFSLLLAPLAFADPPPVDRPGEARPVRHWDFQDGHLRVTLDPATGEVLQGHVTWTIAPYGLPHDRVRLDAIGLRDLRVEVDGSPVSPRISEQQIDVPVTPGDGHTLDVYWTAQPQLGLHGRAPQGKRGPIVWSQGQGSDHRHWFPGWDHPSDTFTLTTSVTVPQAHHAVANGLLVDTTPDPSRPGWTTWTYRLDQPIVNYLVALVAGDLEVATLDGPVSHEILRPSDVDETDAALATQDSPAMMVWFNDLLGTDYPYPIYRQAVVPRFMYGGMENASLTILTDRYLSGGDEPLDRWNADGLIAHELAHQWFGDLLTCNGWRDLWLNEGFATYYAGRWAEHIEGDEAGAHKVLGWLDAAITTTAPMAARSWAQGEGFSGIYPRGAFVLHMLRQLLGTDVFDQAIATYVAQHRFSLVETADLRQVMEEAAGQDLRWFFDRWVHGWGAPSIQSHWEHADGQLTLTVQQEGDAPYHGPVAVWWADEDGQVHRARIHLTDRTSRLTIPATSVAWVLPDPLGEVIADWDRQQVPAAWVRTLQQAPASLPRLLAVRALGEAKADRDAVATALVQAVRGEHRHGEIRSPERDRMALAQSAAAALGNLGTPEARNGLLDAIDHPHLLVRDQVLKALGSFPLDEEVEAALRRATRQDPHLALRATALRALAEARPEAAVAVARQVLSRPDREHQGRQHEAAAQVLGDWGGPPDLANLEGATRQTRRKAQHAAGEAMVAIVTRAPHHDDVRLRARTARALTPWLTHEDARTRRLGAILLGRLAAPEEIGALQAAQSATLDPAMKRALEVALRASRARNATPTTPDALAKATAEIEAIQEQLEAMQQRLKDLEAR